VELMEDDAPSKAVQIGKVSASGSIYLFAGRIASTVIAAIGTIILGLLIAEGDYGLYAIALIPSTTLLLFQDWGIGSAITRKCAQCRANQSERDLRKTILAGLTFEITIALILTTISILTANFLATTVFEQPKSAFLMVVASTSILSIAVFTVIQNVFVGFDRMKLIALVSILQAIVQSIIAPVLIFLGYGALGAMIGFVLTAATGSIVSLILLYFFIYKKLERVKISRIDMMETLKPLIRYGIPLAIGTLLAGLLTQFSSFLMATYVKDLTMIGNYKIALNFSVLLGFFTVPISTVLFPAFSKLDPKKELSVIRSVFSTSVKYAALILVPATMILVVLSNPIITALYGNKWANAPGFLTLSILINLFSCLGYLTVANFASGLGDTKIVLKMNIVQLLFGIPLALILIPLAGISGMIIGALISGIPCLFIYLYLAWKKYGTKIDFVSSAKIFLSSLLSAVVTYLVLDAIPFMAWVDLVVGAVVFIAIYLTSVSLLGAIKQTDIDNLRSMFVGLGFVSKILEIPLGLIEKIIAQTSALMIRKND
jgi:O-antigen/teichoic acid export membrane protein